MKERQNETYIDESGCELGEWILWQCVEHFVQPLVQRLLDLVPLNVPPQVVSYKWVVHHFDAIVFEI